MRIEKILKLALVLLILGVACLIAFKLIGSTIDASGFLHEPFILMVVGWFLIGLGAIHFIFYGITVFIQDLPKK